jgi:hypothetical protein
MGQIITKLLSEKYWLVYLVVVGILILNNSTSSSPTAPQPCAPGLTLCNTECKNLNTDLNNCGSCGTICSGANESCTNGVCLAPNLVFDEPESCGENQVNCLTEIEISPGEIMDCCLFDGNYMCTEVSSDVQNCGSCNNVCSDSEICNNGICYDPQLAISCGLSPVVCRGNETCCRQGGDFSCVNTLSDTRHCGICENDCEQRDGLGAFCELGSCRNY